MSATDSAMDSDGDIDTSVEDDSEVGVLLDQDSDDSVPLTANLERALSQSLADYSERRAAFGPVRNSQCTESFYGHPLTVQDAAKIFPAVEEGGLIWHSLLLNGDPFDENGKLKRGLNQRDFDLDKKTIKPRRAALPILAKDFFSSLTRIEGPRWIFHGILNGWPSLQTFEVISIQRRRQRKEIISPTALLTGQRVWAHMWSLDKEGKKGIDPAIREKDAKGLIFRIKLRGPPWSSRGWSKENPGFAFWYEAQKQPQPTLTYGMQILETVDPTPICTHVHMVSHRYAQRSKRENIKDLNSYHSFVFLEWNHGQYCTVIEGAFLNGLAGWRGKSQFYHDMNAPITQMYEYFPPEMVCPWLTNAAELRCCDVEAKSLDEMKQFMQQYHGHDGRFVDPHYNFSHPCRLSYCSKKNIAKYLLNYIRRDVSYSVVRRNCQTLAADLCAFLCGKREVLPFHPVNRIEYKNRTHLFLYEPDMYDQSEPRNSLEANKSLVR